MLVGPALIEGVERTNIVIVYPTQRAGLVQCSLYAMDVDRKKNCYSCGEFGHLAQNCKRQIMGQRRMVEYENNRNNKDNLNGEGDLIVLD